MQIEAKQNCTNMKFSPGSYIYIAKKVITECEMKFKDNTTFIYEDLEIRVVEFHAGHELNNRHIDTKVVFAVNGQKVVMHCYNSTQNLKLDGAAHTLFLEKFLRPLLSAQIDDFREEIEIYDKNVIASLNSSPKGPMKGISVKKVRSNIDQQLFTCKTCQIT